MWKADDQQVLNAINKSAVSIIKHPDKVIDNAIKDLSNQEDKIPKDTRTLFHLIVNGDPKKAEDFAENKFVHYSPYLLFPEEGEGKNIFDEGESLFAKTEVSSIKTVVDLNIVNVELKGSLSEYKNVSGVYVHIFDSGTIYVGQAKDLSDRPVKSLSELLDKTGKLKGTAAKAGDVYSGRTILIKLEGSGATSLDELENQVLQKAGGTMKQGGNTYNIRRISGY